MLSRRALFSSSVFSAAVLLAAGAACRGQAPTPSASTTTTRQLGPAEITFLAWAGAGVESDMYHKFVADFMTRFSQIKVNLILEANLTDEYKKLVAMVAGGAAPDVAQVHYSNGVDLAARNAIQPLDQLMARDRISRSDYVPGVIDAFQWKGVQHAIPKDNALRVLFYNMDMFDRAGIPYPDDTWTWETFLDVAKRLTIVEGGVVRQWGTTDIFFQMNDSPSYSLVRSFGGDLYNRDLTEFTITRDETVEAIQFSADVRAVHRVAPASNELPAPGDAFRNGFCAMNINFAQQVFFLKQEQRTFRYDVTVLPRGRAGHFPCATGSAHAIPVGARHPEHGWELIKYLTGPQAQRQITELKRWGSSRVDTLEAILPTDGVPKHFKEVFIEPLQGKSKWKVIAIPIPPRAQEIAELYDKEFADVRSGKRTAKEAAAALKPQVDALLRSSG
jgi:multiple sugar transport system substrate-binding protein